MRKTNAKFIEPMLLLRSDTLPDSDEWIKEIKLDGYRSLAIRAAGKIQLRSRNDNDFNGKYPAIVKALAALPDETVIDGEVVAFDESGQPSFNALQNYGSSTTPVFYYIFDVLVLAGHDVMGETLENRRKLLDEYILPKLSEPIRQSPELNGSLSDLIRSVRAQGLEGLVAKRRDSRYEPGQRSGAWRKMRVNQGQEFVIGGYTPSLKNFDALILGYYDGDRLIYVARTRNGFTPALREERFRRIRPLETRQCPFANLPEGSGRWGQGLTAKKMADCRWLRPTLVAQCEFAEWTPDNHLRHSRYVGLREDKAAKDVRRE